MYTEKIYPYCTDCQSIIEGYGTEETPYHCKCGEWVYDQQLETFILKK